MYILEEKKKNSRNNSNNTGFILKIDANDVEMGLHFLEELDDGAPVALVDRTPCIRHQEDTPLVPLFHRLPVQHVHCHDQRVRYCPKFKVLADKRKRWGGKREMEVEGYNRQYIQREQCVQ